MVVVAGITVVSIHAPVRERRESYLRDSAYYRFNSRSRKGATALQTRKNLFTVFQFTLP